MKQISDAEASVEEFNDICGNLVNVDRASIDLQIGLCFEEMTEVIDAFDQLDLVELSKEAADLWIVATGLMQKLEKCGVDMGSVLEAVCEDNLGKFIPHGQPLQYDEAFSASLNQTYKRWVIKDSAGKVRKASTYKKADVSQFVSNKDFLKESNNEQNM